MIPYPYAHYKMNDDAANTIVVDAGLGANNGVSTANTSLWNVAGKINDALEIQGSNQYIGIDGVVSTLKGDAIGSIAFWLNTTVGSYGWDFFKLGNSRSATSDCVVLYKIPITATLYAIGIAAIVGGVTKYYAYTGNLSINTLRHVIVTHDGIIPRIYVNNSLQSLTWGVQTDKTVWFSGLTTPSLATIGYGSNTSIFDDFRIYRSVLSADGRALLYNDGDGTEETQPRAGKLYAFDGSDIIRIKLLPATASHKFRIKDNYEVKGICLVDTADGNASKIRVYDGSAIKALEKVS